MIKKALEIIGLSSFLNEKCQFLLCTEKIYDKMSKNLESEGLEDIFMANTYKVIDEKTWGRNMHCMVF